MNINKFFEDINDKKREMEKALKKYVDATEDFYTLTGVKYTEMPKSKGNALGFDDLLANIEELHEEYLDLRKEYKSLYNCCMKYINKLDNIIHRLIIEYTYINLDDDKKILSTLSNFHNINYSYGHFRNVKSKAIKEFKKIVTL